VNIDLDPVADLATAIRELTAVLTRQNAGSCPSICGVADHSAPDYPCVLLPSHPGEHRDRDGDTWQ
jgi:hypothetical protein